ncbi:MAG: Asp-tRNA(Asn)/Glu-tRNA(Gln) amidotransferase subunit GatA, partial [Pelolinea sp.]|nr:Asp-tRNA(Asn)/Glu-tRNA(Gln) amidotransferase subunit GatA [Pelolinea sp.]
MDVCDLTAFEISRMLRGREVSALEVTESCLERIQSVDGAPGHINCADNNSDDGKVHAFINPTPEMAYKQARAVDKKLAMGEDLSPLAGIPFSVKDIFCVRETLTTAASRILANFTAPYTATPVERMINAGGVMI